MSELPTEEQLSHTVTHLLAPSLSALIFLFVLVYFSLVRKRISHVYPYYALFLSSFVIFLIGRPIQAYTSYLNGNDTLFIRFIILYGIGIPSLLVAASIQSGIKNRKTWLRYSYALGMLIAVLYCISVDAAIHERYVSSKLLSDLGLPVSLSVAHTFQVLGAILLLVIPCSLLLVTELRSERKPQLIAYLSGSLIFGILITIAIVKPMKLEYMYIGSILTAIIWVWAVFRDIGEMTGRVGMLKDELQMLVRSGSPSITPEVERLLDDLERHSEGNLDIYKMRVREILSRIADSTIEAGGDSEELLKRNRDRSQAADAAQAPEDLRRIVTDEAVALSELIASIPDTPSSPIVENAKSYIAEHFKEAITVDQIAEHLNVSRSHFMRRFKLETGKTVNQHITGVRIQNAKQLLRTQSVTETAFAVGFNDSNYFSTVFKKQTGKTPLEYKKVNDDTNNQA
ncbi:helix-turn-helix transcriptional regulator [Pelagicoccus mobilis]|uniref:AraC family transcriptional regulator n=1 Tax=Pelagicoccus mobilis TaxID=415221 RepID=A0A934S1D4_9BACT|nr:AraC family transcriptional regulator [Pelagicoccus mobilis]MBK1878082.1 AraC family transcriptional regulator [Pelagicoccus mobilis]